MEGLNKNEEYTAQVTGVNSGGEGVARINGRAVFVRGALPGDLLRIKIVKIQKDYAYGIIAGILEPSDSRTEPACKVYGKCGGCSLMHCEYNAQLTIKAKIVSDATERIGRFDNAAVSPAIGMHEPFRYRNKAQFPVGPGMSPGFYAPRSHRIVPAEECLIQHPRINELIRAATDFLRSAGVEGYDETVHSGVLRHVVVRVGHNTGDYMVMPVFNSAGSPLTKKQQHEMVSALRLAGGEGTLAFNYNDARTNVVMGKGYEVISGPGHIKERVGEAVYEISPLSFFQVNTVQTEVLFKYVLSFCGFSGSENVLDAYSGIGAISIYLAPHVKKVTGIEESPAAVSDAKKNAAANRLGNVDFILGRAEDMPQMKDIDVAVLDPPRTGCHPRLISKLIEMRPKKIIYVSCDPATFARDLRLLSDGGYGPGRIRPVDMFPMTAQIECVAEII